MVWILTLCVSLPVVAVVIINEIINVYKKTKLKKNTEDIANEDR